MEHSLRIVVDLTPILPGGANGGAKLLSLELIRQWSRELAPHWEYILLTSKVSHDELAWLDSENVRRVCVNCNSRSKYGLFSGMVKKIARYLYRLFIKLIGGNKISYLFALYKRLFLKPKSTRLLNSLGADLVFCPFTAPFYYDQNIPIVIVVHDLQYIYYPQFFTPEEIFYTNRYFQESSKVATRLICVSEHTRQTVLQNAFIEHGRVKTILSNSFNQLPNLDEKEIHFHLQDLGLEKGMYLFYPANFWPHKNHSMLLTAYAMYLRRFPQSKLQLVFTGEPSPRMIFFEKAVERMGLKERVHFLGFVSVEHLAAVLDGCRALIFPSLFEGFGSPVMEAMMCGKPVLCSRVTSLPEVGGDAVFYFDPRKLEEIYQAIQKADQDSAFLEKLTLKSRERAKVWVNTNEWARQYLDVFLEAAAEKGRLK